MRNLSLLLTSLLLVVSGCARVNVYPTGTDTAAKSTASAAADTAKKADDPFKPWDKTLKDTKAVDGFFKFHRKRDNTLFAELRPDQLDKDFGMMLHISRGVAHMFMEQGAPMDFVTRLMRFTRVGDQIHLVQRNPRFTAEHGTAMRRAVESNVGHSVIAVFKIESENQKTKDLLVDATSFFASDYAGLSDRLKFIYGNKPVKFDKEKSYVASVAGFEKNVELDAELAFEGSENPVIGGESLSDPRKVPVRMRYSMFALPETLMAPRAADDRVGHFLDAVWDYSRDQEPSYFNAYLRRWRLECEGEPAADGLCTPRKQIVFYIDHTVPEAYRKYVREGIEGWNPAFEAAGFRNAIVAKAAPDDSTWSAEDARYSTIRWIPHPGGFAYGPSQTDPRTGEILNADVIVSASYVSYLKNEFDRFASPDAMRQFYESITDLARLESNPQMRNACMAQVGKSLELGFQYTALVGLGIIDGPMPEEYIGDALRDLIMHEVGHTIGLRHNFKASSGVPYDQLNDTDFTREHGLSLSVMDYAPVNLALDREKQGDYWNMQIGTYDKWAVKYAYMPIPATAAPGTNGNAAIDPELAALREVAAEATRPLHTYGTDEDNWLGPWAVDPLTNGFDLGSDPLRFAADRAEIVRQTLPNLDRRLINEGDGYQPLRLAFTSMLWQRLSALLPVTKTVGGMHVARDHKGDPNGRAPFTPVAAARQREAVQLIVDQAFAPGAFTFDPDLLNKLAPNRLAHWGANSFTRPIDFPVHDYVSTVHSILLGELLHPARLTRMADNEVRSAGEAYSVSEMLQTLTSAVWTELSTGREADSFRRDLQRAYTKQLIRLLLDSPKWMMSASGAIPVPEHTRSLARLELSELAERIDRAADRPGISRDARAHLLETRARIGSALQASLAVPVQ